MNEQFKILKVKCSPESKSLNYLFYKQHLIKQKEEGQDEQIKASNRTLFVINIPNYYTEETLKYIFSCYGSIDRVYLHSKPTIKINNTIINSSYFNLNKTKLIKGFKCAYVVFNNPLSLQKSLNQSMSDNNDDFIRVLNNSKQQQSVITTGLKSKKNTINLFTSVESTLFVFDLN